MRDYPNTGVDWRLRQGGAARRLLRGLERFSLALERPLARLARHPQWNPLYHTGPITVFLLLVIGLTGVYLTLFYPFGFSASYQAVAGIESNLLGRTMRALHRYASGAAVIFALLHGWRTFFQDRFRGPRWPAWLTGVLMMPVVWIIGLTGYWLIWDRRAQALNQALARLIGGANWGQSFLVDQVFLPEAGVGWIFVLLVISVHVGLSLAVGGMLWLHLMRLNRPKWLPPKYWMAAVGLLLLAAALLVPAGMLPKADAARLAQEFPLDGFFLWNVPPALSTWAQWVWPGVLLFTALVSAAPWLLGSWTRRPLPPVTLLAGRCIGCTLCAQDCPYRALSMVERGLPGQPKYIAVLHPQMCVACGICVGSCPTDALQLNPTHAVDVHSLFEKLRPGWPGMAKTTPAMALTAPQAEAQLSGSWQAAVMQAAAAGRHPTVMFTCERHAFQGAARAHLPEGVIVAPLSCIAMAHPDVVSQAMALGAQAVQFVGCPPEDCANREGNLWMQQRLDQTRLPRLRRVEAGARLSSAWLSPDVLAAPAALAAPDGETPAAGWVSPSPLATAYTVSLNMLRAGWRQWLPVLALLAAALAAQVAFSALPYRPYAADQAQLEIVLRHRPGAPIMEQGAVSALGAAIDAPRSDGGQARLSVKATYPAAVDDRPVLDESPAQLQVWINGALEWRHTIQLSEAGRARKLRFYAPLLLSAGRRQVEVRLLEPGLPPLILFQGEIILAEGEIRRLVFEDQVSGGDPDAGEKLYYDGSAGSTVGCRICHALRPGEGVVGPSFAGVATRAAGRVPGMAAEDYLRQSILEPDAYTVPGYPPGQMVQNYDEILTPQQIEDLVAFLMTLK